MAYVITDGCVDIKDLTCITECPVDCIYEGPRSLYINPEECIDCGACEVVCPVNAIVADFDIVNDTQAAARRRSHEIFLEIGSPMGAKEFGPLSADHSEISAMPARQV
jgi:NAD-dependent dihydropyrimidine dehydrogenase PreA subunit